MEIFIILPFIILAGFITLVSFLLFLFMKNKQGDRFQFTAKNIFLFYLYFMIFASLITFSFGTASSLKASFAKVFGAEFISAEFRYTYEQLACEKRSWADDVSEEYKKQQISQCEEDLVATKKQLENRKNQVWQDNLLQGLTLLVIGSLFLILHILMLKKISLEESSYIIRRLFLILNLLFFGIGSITALSVSIHSTLQYFLLTNTNNYYYSSPVPGAVLGHAVVFTPIWLYFIKLFWQDVKLEKSEPSISS